MLASNFVKSCKLVSPMSYLQTCARRGVFWGHNTLEEQEAAKKKELEKGMVLKWTDPDQAVDIKKSTYYSPMRIEQEEKALSSGFSKVRFNVTDWFEFAMQPIFPWLMNPQYYHCQKRIKIYNRLIEQQRFVRERLIALGPDLSAAHFLVARGCRVMFKGQNHWLALDSKGRLPENLPSSYVSGWYIEKIDASDSLLIYEGFQNIRNLIYLKSLDLSYCPLIDEWCMDRITGEFGESLEVLNLSGCTNIDWNGLECLWRLRKLKTLILRDMDHVRDIKLICLMLLDIFPDLDIQGVDYIDTKLLEGTEHEQLIKELDIGMTTLLPGPQHSGDGPDVDKSSGSGHEAKSEAQPAVSHH